MSNAKQANVTPYGKLDFNRHILYEGGTIEDNTVEDVQIAAAATTLSSSTNKIIPANCQLLCVAFKVLAAIPGPATMDIGVTGTAAAFFDDVSTVVGTSGVKRIAMVDYPTALQILVTPVSTPTAATGKIRFETFWRTYSAPNSENA